VKYIMRTSLILLLFMVIELSVSVHHHHALNSLEQEKERHKTKIDTNSYELDISHDFEENMQAADTIDDLNGENRDILESIKMRWQNYEPKNFYDLKMDSADF